MSRTELVSSRYSTGCTSLERASGSQDAGARTARPGSAREDAASPSFGEGFKDRGEKIVDRTVVEDGEHEEPL